MEVEDECCQFADSNRQRLVHAEYIKCSYLNTSCALWLYSPTMICKSLVSNSGLIRQKSLKNFKAANERCVGCLYTSYSSHPPPPIFWSSPWGEIRAAVPKTNETIASVSRSMSNCRRWSWWDVTIVEAQRSSGKRHKNSGRRGRRKERVGETVVYFV